MAVIFDVDGVLVDSYEAHFESWRRLAAQTGAQFTREQFAATFGRTSRDIIREHWGERLSDAEIALMDERKEAIYRELINGRFPAMDGARELIDELHRAGFMLAVASSGPPENIQLTLTKLGRADRFRAVVTGRDVQRGKPDPQVFLIAAKRLGVEPRRCIVVEDAPAGVQAARSAGMRCIALLNHGRSEADFNAAPADVYVRSLRDINAHAREINPASNRRS